MDKIYTGTDKAIEKGFKSYRDLIINLAKITGHEWKGEWSDSKVYARIDFGRWIADCECGAASYVDPHDDLFYCATCGNHITQGRARHCVFPDNYQEIEIELLQRFVIARPGLQGTDAALNSIGRISRSWTPGESIETLKIQREMAEAR